MNVITMQTMAREAVTLGTWGGKRRKKTAIHLDSGKDGKGHYRSKEEEEKPRLAIGDRRERRRIGG